jgi:8-oxo-dGTP diphosphatase
VSILLRHASAGHRLPWGEDDHLRALDERGQRQAAELVDELVPLGIRRIVSSPYMRCVETVEPLAAALGLEVEQDERLAEGAEDSAAELLREEGVVACTHGDVIYALLGRHMRKAEFAVL